MINEELTFLLFQYYSTDLKPSSHKKVIANCDKCGKERILKFQDYRDLCISCKLSSKETRQKMSIASQGNKNSHWNPNLTDEDRKNRKNRKYPEYTEWRNLVFKRDNYTCQKCNKRGGNINAHHFESYSNYPELRTTLSNGITLCKECHNDFHHQYGYSNNTKEQFEEFRA